MDACTARCRAWYAGLHPFERPDLRGPDIQAARQAVRAAFAARDRAGLEAALRAFEWALMAAMMREGGGR
jgi:hypothetical protein